MTAALIPSDPFPFTADRERRLDALGMVAKDFPDALVDQVDHTGAVEAFPELLDLCDSLDLGIGEAWAWLTESLTQAEAVAWLVSEIQPCDPDTGKPAR